MHISTCKAFKLDKGLSAAMPDAAHETHNYDILIEGQVRQEMHTTF